MNPQKVRLILLAQEIRRRARHYIDEATCSAAGLTIRDLHCLAAGGCPLQAWQVRALARGMKIDTELVA